MPLTPGQVLLDKYRIKRLLGSGGWGDVYLAEDLALGRQVAIKHLKADWTRDETILERFLQEARIIAALKHSNVVVIHALEHDGNEHYIVEEYAERGTVGDLLEKPAGLPIKQTLDIAIAVCRALEAAHLKGIIHRDIKPSNILLCESPEGDLIPKLCDFGIAHVPNTEGKRPLTSKGTVLGTAQYMSPEQIEGGKIDECSDIYSLGAVLYEMVTGRPAFTGSVWDILQSHVNKEPQPPILERPGISDSLNDLILRALSKDPGNRYQKARDMQKALEQIKRQEAEKQEEVASLYDQGVAHLQAGEWQEAAQSLSSAAALASGYRDVEELLEKAKRQERLTELYDLGLAYICSGAWAEAVETLRAVYRLDEHYRDVAERLKQAQTQQKLATLYSEGVSAAQARDWATAASKFSEILQVEEDYRDVTTQLEETEKQLELADLYAQGIARLEQEEWLDAIRCFRDIITEDVTYEDVTSRLKYARQQDELESTYSQGCGYARQGKWPQAIAHFEAVLKVDESYKDTAIRLKEVQKQEELETLYIQGMQHLDRGEWAQAIHQFQGVLSIDPKYKDATARLEEVQWHQELRQMYRQGKEHFDKEEWQQAIDLLKQVIGRESNYQDAGVMLEEACLQIELDDLYATALHHEAAEEWDKAGDLYLKIQTKRRGYKDTTLRLAEVVREEKLLALYLQACELLEAKKWSAAVAKLRETQTLDSDYKDVSQLLQRAEEQERLLALYRQAEGDLARENWLKAIKALKELLGIDEGYRDAAHLLQEASYSQGMLHQQEGQLEEAIQCFEQAEGYEDAQDRLAKVKKQKDCRDLFEAAKEHCDKEEWSETQKAIERLRELDSCQAFVIEKAEELTLMEAYSQGMGHFERQEWWEAIKQFRRVKETDSGYRGVSAVLESAEDSNLLRRNYTILKEISTTGTTRVHKAKNRSGDLVAIKRLASSYLGAHEPQSLIEPLRKGAELTKKLQHPCIVNVRVYEIRGSDEAGEYRDMHIVVMDYVEGEDLATVLNKRKKLRVGEALLIAEQVCQALVHAHSKSVFHGDLKPSNLLLSKDRQVKITDFANAPYGTPSFRPPEQAGEKTIGAHTDIYSLGQVICKLVTGQSPFRAGDAKSPLPKSLERLVDKATRREPEERYGTARDMLADIRQANSWRYRSEERLHELMKYKMPLLRNLGVLAVLGAILLAIFSAVLEPLMAEWIREWRDGQTATPTVVTEPPVPTNTPIITPYPTPALISPDEGTPFAKGQDVKLVWEWERELADNEFFEARIRQPGQEEFTSMGRTRLSCQLALASKLTQSGTYEWQVAIVSRLGEEKGVSQMWSFEVP